MFNGVEKYFSFLCLNSNISEAFFEKYEPLKVLKWDYLSVNINLSEDFFEKHMKLYLEYRNNNPEILDLQFLDYKISSGQSLSENTFRFYHSKEKIISWMKKNPQYSFDKLIYKYI